MCGRWGRFCWRQQPGQNEWEKELNSVHVIKPVASARTYDPFFGLGGSLFLCVGACNVTSGLTQLLMVRSSSIRVKCLSDRVTASPCIPTVIIRSRPHLSSAAIEECKINLIFRAKSHEGERKRPTLFSSATEGLAPDMYDHISAFCVGGWGANKESASPPPSTSQPSASANHRSGRGSRSSPPLGPGM